MSLMSALPGLTVGSANGSQSHGDEVTIMLARGLLLPVGVFGACVASLQLQVVDLGGALSLMLSVGTETVFTQ